MLRASIVVLLFSIASLGCSEEAPSTPDGVDASADAGTGDGGGTLPDGAVPDVADEIDGTPEVSAPEVVADTGEPDAVPDADAMVDVTIDADAEADAPADADADAVADADSSAASDGLSDGSPTDLDGDDSAVADVADADPDGPEDVAPEADAVDFPAKCGLVVNGGAESGLSGWIIETGEFEATDGGFGSPDPSVGAAKFGAGSSGTSVLVQAIDVAADSDAIDAGGVWAHLDANVRNWNGNDGASLILRALDDGGTLLAEVQGGPWYADVWTPRVVHLELPSGTRTVEVALRGDRESGIDNDAYFDEVDLCLDLDAGVVDVGDLDAPPYLMWVTHDAVTVMWETAEPTVGVVEYGTTLALGNEAVEPADVTTHELRLQGLPADTDIHYRISWGQGVSEVYTFRTAPDPTSQSFEPFRFLVWGDNQNGEDIFGALVSEQMVGEGAQFALSAGDVVQNGTRGEYRSQMLHPISPLAREVPFLIALGNHELYSDPNAELFEEYFAQPGDEFCFGWRWGPVYVQFIDTERTFSAGSAQHACIIAGLTSDDAMAATYRVAVFHKPPRVEYWFGGFIAFTNTMETPEVREELEPLLETLDVQLVFNGHNHLYAYTPETPGGITWVTTGGAGGSLDTDNFLWKVGDWPEIETQIHEHHYMRVDVDDSAMTVSAIGTDGGLLHTFGVAP